MHIEGIAIGLRLPAMSQYLKMADTVSASASQRSRYSRRLNPCG